MRRFKGALMILLKIGLAIVLVLVVVNAGLKYFWGRRVESQIAGIKAKGQPVTPADLKAHGIPDAENGAVVYERIFKLMSESPRPGTPGLGSSKDAMDFLSIVKMTPAELKKHPDLLAMARRVISQNKEAFALVQDAQSRPKCRFATNWEAGPAVYLPHNIAKIRGLTRLLATRAVVDAQDGRMDDAVQSLDQAFKINESLKDEPTVLLLLVRIATLRISSRALKTVASYQSLNERQAKQLYDTISAVDLNRAYASAMVTERVLGMRGFEMFKSGFPAVMRYGNEAAYLDLANKQIAGANLSYREAKSSGLLDPGQVPVYAYMVGMLAPVFVKANTARYLLAAELAQTQVFLAAQAYRARFGSYPRGLDELKSRLGWELPLDPFSERDLVYIRRGNGFILYSIGPDMKDNGGRVEMKGGFPPTSGDIVLRWER